jgi:dTDP-glucose 4,6-dehydratase
MKSTLLVTGGAGFIGSAFVLDAIARGHRVVTLDLLTYAGVRANLDSADASGGHVFVHGDICDEALVSKVLGEHKPSAIVHFAAESHVDRSIDGPEAFVRTNVVGTLALLQASRKYVAAGNALRFLHVSTDEVYGSLGPEGYFTELSRVEPNSPYAASKASSDHLVRAYFQTYGLDAVTTNCCNNYGPRQFPEKLIPLVTLNALEGMALPIYGDGQQRRDWIYVDDHCEGVFCALERGHKGETYLLGARAETTNLAMVHSICDALEKLRPAAANPAVQTALAAQAKDLQLGYRGLITYVQDRPGHDKRYAIDPSKSEREIGFRAKQTLQSGVDATVAWYLANEPWWRAIHQNTYGRERLGKA